MNRNVKTRSAALAASADALATYEGVDLPKSSGRRSIEGHDWLAVHGDEFVVYEMQDGRFWAGPNFDPSDEDSTFEQHMSDVLDQHEFVKGPDGVEELTVPEADVNYHGAYFADLAAALAACHAWKLGATIPRDYAPPLKP